MAQTGPLDSDPALAFRVRLRVDGELAVAVLEEPWGPLFRQLDQARPDPGADVRRLELDGGLPAARHQHPALGAHPRASQRIRAL